MLSNQIIIYLEVKSRYYFLEHICSKIFLHGNTRDKTTAYLAAVVSVRQRGQKHRFALIFWYFFIREKVHKTIIVLPFFVFYTKILHQNFTIFAPGFVLTMNPENYHISPDHLLQNPALAGSYNWYAYYMNNPPFSQGCCDRVRLKFCHSQGYQCRL